MITTESNSSSIYLTPITWKGQTVYLKGEAPSLHCAHEVEVMHHLGDGGLHYCPTTFIWCPKCGATGDEPEPYECSTAD